MPFENRGTAEERAALVRDIRESRVPEHLRDGLVRYFADGILPGGFLQAVLCNVLEEAMARHFNPAQAAATISTIHGFLLEHAPADAWGSRAKVLAWTTTPDRLEIASKADALAGHQAMCERVAAAIRDQ